MWDLWKEFHESTEYEATPAYTHWREALPLWSLRSAFPLLQHAENPPREVFAGQKPSSAGLLHYCQSHKHCRDGNTDGRQPTSARHGLFSIICASLGWRRTIKFSSALRYAALLHWKDRLQDPVMTALCFHIISMWVWNFMLVSSVLILKSLPFPYWWSPLCFVKP